MKIFTLIGLILALKGLTDCLLLVSGTYDLFLLDETRQKLNYQHIPFVAAFCLLGLNLLLTASYLFTLAKKRTELISFVICHFFVYLALLAAIVLIPESVQPSHQYADPYWTPDGSFIIQILSSLFTHVLTSILSSALLIFLWFIREKLSQQAQI